MRRTVLPIVLAALALGPVAAAAADPAKPGRFPVGVTTVAAVDASRDRSLPTEIWYPAKTAERNAVPRAGRYPLILMAHGFCGSRTNYEYLTAHLASWGFMVAAPDFVGLTDEACAAHAVSIGPDVPPVDLSFVCRLLHDTSGPMVKWAAHVRGIPTGLVGHSLGGYAVVEAAKQDPSFTAIVPLAPAEQGPDLAAAHRPHMVMGGTADATVPFDGWTVPFFDGLAAPKFLVRIAGGTHSGFTDVDAGLSPAALAAQETVVKREATAFFVRYLAHKAKLGRWLRTSDDGTVAITARPK